MPPAATRAVGWPFTRSSVVRDAGARLLRKTPVGNAQTRVGASLSMSGPAAVGGLVTPSEK